MEITEVRIKLVEDFDDRLQAFCSITFGDCFVVRDLKIIDGSNGPFVAMPSRKLTVHGPKCSCKNHLRAKFCNQCSARLDAYGSDPRTSRSHEAICRHRASDQFCLSRCDSGTSDHRIRSGTRTRRFARLCVPV